MDVARHEFFSGTALPTNEDRTGDPRELFRFLDHSEEGLTAADPWIQFKRGCLVDDITSASKEETNDSTSIISPRMEA